MSRPLDGFVVVFDLDGTLVDTAPDLIGSLNVVLAEQGLAGVPVASARHLVGLGARSLIRKGFAEAGQSIDDERVEALTARFIDVYSTRLAEESFIFPGAVEALEALEADGARLAVCTNKPEVLALPLLEQIGLSPRFAAMVGWTESRPGKPHAGMLLAAIAQAGGSPQRALLVGDSAADVQTARNAGAPVLVVDWGYTETPAAELGGDDLVSDFAQVPAAVRRLLTVAA